MSVYCIQRVGHSRQNRADGSLGGRRVHQRAGDGLHGQPALVCVLRLSVFILLFVALELLSHRDILKLAPTAHIYSSESFVQKPMVTT